MNLFNLPLDIYSIIFINLSDKELRSLIISSKQFKFLDNNYIWKCLYSNLRKNKLIYLDIEKTLLKCKRRKYGKHKRPTYVDLPLPSTDNVSVKLKIINNGLKMHWRRSIL